MIHYPEFRAPRCPDWVRDAIFYQIFPDRFARSPRTRQPRGIRLKPWGSPPEEQGFQGGDLHGIVDKLDYLQFLGVNALYLNPVFSSAANHRYHTYDYYTVDPLLGGDDALRELLDAAHGRGMRLILDGVFNHTGRGFWQFHHILENGGNSPYIDWFFINDWPLRPYNHDDANPHNYVSWWNLPALPKFNTGNPGVRDFLLDVARHWIEFGVDGWRLDVPAEIDDDLFWRDFRAVVKGANPDAYLVGEIWTPAQRWLQGDQFDAVMNYQFTVPVLNFCGGRTLRQGYQKAEYDLRPFDAPQFAAAVERMYAFYDWEINHAQLNLLDSHDTARALWIMGDDHSALRLAVLLQMTMLGAPCIYYGDEIGLSAADDPYCREAFPWHDEGAWDQTMLAHYRQLTTLRQELPVLRRGAFQALYAEGHVYAFRRTQTAPDGALYEAIVAVNAGDLAAPIDLPLAADSGSAYLQVWPEGDKSYTAADGKLPLILPPRGGLVLVNAG
ncbi:MAG: glycoside hydrolase family 13 protein [Candidatus Promineifilaceae bacterium]